MNEHFSNYFLLLGLSVWLCLALLSFIGIIDKMANAQTKLKFWITVIWFVSNVFFTLVVVEAYIKRNITWGINVKSKRDFRTAEKVIDRYFELQELEQEN